MQTIKEMIQQIQGITFEAYKASGQAAALLGEPSSPPEAMVKALEQTAASMEQGTVELRALCESCLPELLTIGRKPVLPPLDVAGSISVNEFGWLLIELNTLLPHPAGPARAVPGKAALAGPGAAGYRGVLRPGFPECI